MEVCRIVPSNGRELVFEGVRITTVSGNPEDKVAPGRWHEISAYRRSDGAWVVSIHYCTGQAGERQHTEAEVIDDPAEIEYLLLAYEPWEHMNRRTLDYRSSDERKRLSNRVWTNYLDLVNRVLADLAPYLPASAPEVETRTQPEE